MDNNISIALSEAIKAGKVKSLTIDNVTVEFWPPVATGETPPVTEATTPNFDWRPDADSGLVADLPLGAIYGFYWHISNLHSPPENMGAFMKSVETDLFSIVQKHYTYWWIKHFDRASHVYFSAEKNNIGMDGDSMLLPYLCMAANRLKDMDGVFLQEIGFFGTFRDYLIDQFLVYGKENNWRTEIDKLISKFAE